MDNSGAFTLGDISLTATDNTINGDPVENLDGLRGFTAQAVIQAGDDTADDATVSVFVQTSIDQGGRWGDVGVMRFGASGGVRVITVEVESTPLSVVPTDGGLEEDSNSAIFAGIMGDRLRAKVVKTGVWGGQSVANVRVCVR